MSSEKPAVLFLSYDGLTDPLGQSQILPYLSGLSGYSITIISFEKQERYESGKAGVYEFCKVHQLNWQPMPYHKRPPVLSTLYDIARLRRKAKSLHRQHRFGIVHCRSYITAIVGLWMKRNYKVKFIFDMRGFWADERVEGGLWNLNNPVYRSVYSFFKKKERQFVKEADEVIALTENAKEEILRWNLNSAITVIPCCVDLNRFDPRSATPSEREALRNELGFKPGDFVLLYVGSLGTWYMTSEMLDFFTQLKKLKSDTRFLLLTPDRIDIENHPFHQDIVFRSVSHSRVPLFISLAGASVIFIKPVFSKKGSSATKMAEVLAMGVPVVTNTGWGDIDRWESRFPGLVTVSEPADYPNAIGLVLREQNAAHIREAAWEHFSLSHGVALYNAVYHRLSH